MKPLQVLSLGAGVQSTTMALMAAHGEITPMPDAAIFADTMAEPADVYKHLEWLCSPNVLPFPVHIVTNGNLREDTLRLKTAKSGNQYTGVEIPTFVKHPVDGKRPGMQRRSCTQDYKILPIRRKLREMIGLKPRQRGPKETAIIQWIGISRDEASRMKPARDRWIENRWPLIDSGMTREGCLKWMNDHDYPTPPRSACTFCPFHSDAEWRNILNNSSEEFADVVEYERQYQDVYKRVSRFLGTPFFHSSMMPLDTVDLAERPDLQINMFENECEGMCGV